MNWTCSNCNKQKEIETCKLGFYIRCDKCNHISFIEYNGKSYESPMIGCKGCFNYISPITGLRVDDVPVSSSYCLINPEGLEIDKDICPLLYAKHAESNIFYNLNYKSVKRNGVNIACTNKEQFDNFIELITTLCKRRKYSYEIVSGLPNTVDPLYDGNICIINIRYLDDTIRIDFSISPTAEASTIFYENILCNWSIFLLSLSSFFTAPIGYYDIVYSNCIDIVNHLTEKRYTTCKSQLS